MSRRSFYQDSDQAFWEGVGALFGGRLVSWRGRDRAQYECSREISRAVADALIRQKNEIDQLRFELEDRAIGDDEPHFDVPVIEKAARLESLAELSALDQEIGLQ